jgi:hypothetical protein
MSRSGHSDRETNRSRLKTPALLALANWIMCLILASFSLFLSFLNHSALQVLLDENFIIDVIVAVSLPVVGLLIAARRPGNAIWWVFCLIGLSEALSAFSEQYAYYALLTRPGMLPGGAEMAWLQAWIWIPGIGSVLTFLLLLFPSGRLLTHRWRWIAWVSAISIALFCLPIAVGSWKYKEVLLLKTPDQLPGIGLYYAIGSAGLVLLVLCALASTFSLILRFRRATGEERQQLKWFTFTSVILFLNIFVGYLLSDLQLVHINVTLLNAVNNILQVLIFAFIPIALGVAILKHRLFDIDVIINRTLVYGALTFSLALIYFGLVIGLQALVRLFAGQISQSPIVIVASTLVIAALFQPLRQRIQVIIDHRFYRRKYDAAKIVETFNATLRNEVDLSQLRENLLAVVEETMQPAHMSLWLREPDSKFTHPVRIPPRQRPH